MTDYNLNIPASILLLAVLGIGCKKPNCKKEVPDWCALADISNQYAPVCGCDGKTYQNAGYAKCIGGVMDYTEGKCE